MTAPDHSDEICRSCNWVDHRNGCTVNMRCTGWAAPARPDAVKRCFQQVPCLSAANCCSAVLHACAGVNKTLTTTAGDVIALYAAAASNPLLNPPYKYKTLTYTTSGTTVSASVT